MATIQDIMKKLASDPSLMTKLKATKSPQDIVDLAKSEGIDLSLEHVKEALESAKGGKLDLSALSHLL